MTITVAADRGLDVAGSVDRGRRPLIDAAGGWWPGIALALGGFAASRVAQLALVAWLGWSRTGLWDALLAWDAGWFIRVAIEGYPHGYTYGADGELVGNGLAFFPAYPLLIRLVAVTGVAPAPAAIGVAWLASAAAAVLVYLLGTSLYDRRVGYALLAAWCTQPMSVVFSLAYSEALFLALLAGALLAAHRQVWPAAGALGLAAALTRPTGVAVAIALAVAAGMAWRTRQRWPAAAAAAVALAGGPAYLLWVGLRVGDPDAWFRIQRAGWGSSVDGGAGVGGFLLDALRRGEDWVPVSVAWLLVAALLAAVAAVVLRVWPPLSVYGLIALVLVFGQGGYYHSKPRLLVSVLLILVPVAIAAARARPRLAALALGAFALFGLWYGAYLVAVWPYTI